MLQHFLSGHGHDTTQAKSKTPTPTVAEVIPSPEAERNDPVDDTALSRLASQTKGSNLAPAAPKRLSFLGRSTSGYYSFQHEHKIDFVKEQHTIVQRKCRHELGASLLTAWTDTSHAGLLEWIRNERITRIPHKGSSWDRVLQAAHHFGDQVEALHQSVEGFTTDSDIVSRFVYGQCLLLLELGHENASALEKAFGLFYQFGLELRPLLKRGDLFGQAPQIQTHLGRTYSDLVNTVSVVAIHFYQLVHGLQDRHSTISLDIYSMFGSQIEIFRTHLAHCAQEMWLFSLRHQHKSTLSELSALRRWLAPQDSVLAFLASNHVNLAVKPEPFTCTWFQPHLTGFIRSNNNILMVEGKTGSGKTVLANWTIDRLQRSIGRTSVSTLSFAFNPSINAQATTAAMLKTLLYQLFDTAIGNVDLFNALRELQHAVDDHSTANVDEDKIWNTLNKVLEAVNAEFEDHNELLVVVLDGVDEISASSKAAAQKACKNLHALANRLGAVRVIQFSQPLGLNSTHSTRIALTVDQTIDDIHTMIQSSVSTHTHFNDRDLAEQEEIVNELTSAADGSMLWASLACDVLRLKKTHSAFSEAVESLKASPRTISEAIQKLLGAMHLDNESKLVLSWLFAAERPLTLAEIDILLRVDLEKHHLASKPANVASALKALAPFIIVGEGLVALRHSAIEQTILSIPNSSKHSLHLTERHRDLVTRLLAYAKHTLQDHQEPTLELLDYDFAVPKFNTRKAIEYATRYWAVHLKRSTLYKTGQLELPTDIVALFPRSVALTLMERHCWSAQFSASDALELHLLARRVRKDCFGLKDASVLQSTIICASLLETCGRHGEAVQYYLEATKICRDLLGLQAEITYACCTILLRISESLVTKSRTEVMTCREQVYLILISITKHKYGENCKEVIEIYHKLAELYVFICEEHHATEIYQIIQRITVHLHGPGSLEGTEVSRHLEVQLHKHHDKEPTSPGGILFGDVEAEVEETLTLVRVEIIIRLAGQYILRGEYLEAEKLYIELWLKLTQHCHINHTSEWHGKKIEVMLLYARFLQERERTVEASSILLCIWREYEHHEFSIVESIIGLLKEVAVVMTALSMLTFALSVYRKCWSWYKSYHKEEHVVFKEIEVLISQTSVKIVESSTTTTTVSESSETVIREVFESTISSTEISSTTVELCKSLVSIYVKEERYSEAVTCVKSLIKKTWSSFFSESIQSVTVTSSFTVESLEMVVKLAQCYISMSRFDTAEYFYLRLFRAIKASYRVDDKLFIKYSELILAFYKANSLFSKAITFYQELLVSYKAFYGIDHAVTIATLYALGELCGRYQRTHSYYIQYYLEILSINKGSAVCREEALRALIVVAKYYYEDCRYSESLEYFRLILSTFVKVGNKYHFFEKTEEVQELFECYFRSLESRVELSVHISILKEYRKACIEFYREESSITIHATLQIADVCSRTEKYRSEAISYYEHVSKYSKSVEIIKKTTTMLRTLYIKQMTSTTTVWTKEMFERSTTILYEHYVEIRKSYSCTHVSTLSAFRELIMIYFKRSMVETSIKEISSLIVECVTKATSATELIHVAKYFVEILYTCSFVKYGWDIFRELRLQIIYKHKSSKNLLGCGFDVIKVGREAYAFIAAFEYYLRAEYTLTIADYMATLLAESLYYEQFCTHIKSKSTFKVVFSDAARLRQTLSKGARLDYFETIEEQTIHCFLHSEQVIVKASTRAAVGTFVSLLLEYFTEHRSSKNFVASCGHASLLRVRSLLSQKKFREALELTTCTYKYLMAHEGLDDPTEISLGFKLCILMADREHHCQDATVRKGMLDLSRQILSEVFDICKKSKIDLAMCQLSELNDLIGVIAEQKDYVRLQWLLNLLWSSREGQTWSASTNLLLGKRLVQANFIGEARTKAIRLAEDILYNVRRVYGVRHENTLSYSTLLSSLYIATGLHHIKQQNDALAKSYFRKALALHEDALKALVDADGADNSDDDDLDSETGSVTSIGKNLMPISIQPVLSPAIERAAVVKAICEHVRLLKLAYERLGGWVKPAVDYERVTAKVWAEYGTELGKEVKEDQIVSAKWSANAFGGGKAESNDDDWKAPKSWAIVA